MRSLLGLALLLGGVSCGASEDDDSASNSCQEALAIHGAALQKAIDAQPACEADDECIVMYATAECDNFFVSDCGFAAHEDTPDLYAEQDAEQRICDLMSGSKYGCSVTPSCVPEEGRLACREGVCAFVDD